MIAKITYVNQGVTIAIHGDDFARLLDCERLVIPVKLGPVFLPDITVLVDIPGETRRALLDAYWLELSIIEQVKRDYSYLAYSLRNKIVHCKMEEKYGKP